MSSCTSNTTPTSGIASPFSASTPYLTTDAAPTSGIASPFSASTPSSTGASTPTNDDTSPPFPVLASRPSAATPTHRIVTINTGSITAEGSLGVLQGGISVFFPVDPNRAPIILPTTGTRPYPISTIVNTRLMQGYVTTLNINGVSRTYQALDEVLVDGVWTKVAHTIYVDMVDADEGEVKVGGGEMEDGVGNILESAEGEGDGDEEEAEGGVSNILASAEDDGDGAGDEEVADGAIDNNMESAEKDTDSEEAETFASTDTKRREEVVTRRRRSRRSSSRDIVDEDMEWLEEDGVEDYPGREIEEDGDMEEKEQEQEIEKEKEKVVEDQAEVEVEGRSGGLEITYPDVEFP